jgi:hypothetical protein
MLVCRTGPVNGWKLMRLIVAIAASPTALKGADWRMSARIASLSNDREKFGLRWSSVDPAA